MAQGEGNGGKIAIGCCSAVAVVVVLVVAAGFLFAPKMVEKVKEAFQSHEELADSMTVWSETMEDSGGNSEAVSPVAFAGFTRDRQSKDTKPRGLDLGKTGHLAEYSNGPTTLSVWTTKASSLEQEAMRERISTQNEERFSSRSSGTLTAGSVSAVSYSGSPPKEAGIMVLSGDWVVFLQTNNQDLDLHDLLKKYIAEAEVAADAGSAEAGAEATAAEAVESADPAPKSTDHLRD